MDDNFALGLGPDGDVYAVAEAPDGKIFIGGMFASVNGTNHHFIARLSNRGTVDQSFNPKTGPDKRVDAVLPGSNGTVMIGGLFGKYNGGTVNHLIQLASDGNPNGLFSTSAGPDSEVYTIVPASSDLFYIGGIFSVVGDQNRNGIALMSILGQLSSFFTPDFEGGPVNAIAVRPNQKVLKGGQFITVDGKRPGIIQLNDDGSLDPSFNPGTGANGPVNALALTTDGKVIIAGAFSQVNGVTQSNIARLYPDGSLDTTFATGLGANSQIRSIVVQFDGKILIGGDFRSFDGQPRAGLARLHPDGSLDDSFHIGMIGFGAVMCLANQADGGVLVGGSFSGLIPNRPYLARLLPTDTDGDGMPDLWEQAHGLDYTTRDDYLDKDGDGSTNLEEYLAGTDPSDPNSSPKIRFFAVPSGLELRISTVVGRLYELQQASTVENPSWQSSGQILSGDGQDAVFQIPQSETQLTLYRIVISIQ